MSNRRFFPLHIYSLHWHRFAEQPWALVLTILNGVPGNTQDSEQLCWTPDSFESIPKSQTLSTSYNNITQLFIDRGTQGSAIGWHLSLRTFFPWKAISSTTVSHPKGAKKKRGTWNRRVLIAMPPLWAGVIPTPWAFPAAQWEAGHSAWQSCKHLPYPSVFGSVFKVTFDKGPISGKESISEAFLAKDQTLLQLRH